MRGIRLGFICVLAQVLSEDHYEAGNAAIASYWWDLGHRRPFRNRAFSGGGEGPGIYGYTGIVGSLPRFNQGLGSSFLVHSGLPVGAWSKVDLSN